MNITKKDFHRLRTNSSTTLDQKWTNNLSRFVLVDGGKLEVDPNYNRAIYWFGNNYANVLLAKAFLEGKGHSFQLVKDTEMGGAYAVITEPVGAAEE
jgi:hypothetical protein